MWRKADIHRSERRSTLENPPPPARKIAKKLLHQ
jgi:hypothetical protein